MYPERDENHLICDIKSYVNSMGRPLPVHVYIGLSKNATKRERVIKYGSIVAARISKERRIRTLRG